MFFKRKKSVREFSDAEKRQLTKCGEIANELSNIAIKNFPIYVVDSDGNEIEIKSIGFGKHFNSVELRLKEI